MTRARVRKEEDPEPLIRVHPKSHEDGRDEIVAVNRLGMDAEDSG